MWCPYKQKGVRAEPWGRTWVKGRKKELQVAEDLQVEAF